MSDLIKRGQALKCAEHDTETYYALSCLPGVDAIPVEWIREYTEENRLYQSDDFDFYISDMIADWEEREEE